MAVLTDGTSTFVPLVGGLVDKSQIKMEHGVTRQQEEEKDQEAQHEDDSGKGHEQMLEGQREKEQEHYFTQTIIVISRTH